MAAWGAYTEVARQKAVGRGRKVAAPPPNFPLVKTMPRLLGIDGSGVLVVIFLEAPFEGPFPFNISPDDRPLCGGAYDFHKMTTLAGVSEGKRIHLFLALFLSNPGADAG
uniref:Uncharacterized protein n=1 Tax=Oryza rufipogon TaxID=4529 RepID=A0A0E0QZP6_ORYRU